MSCRSSVCRWRIAREGGEQVEASAALVWALMMTVIGYRL